MFASKTAILLFLFTLWSSVLATPPACLLAAVNQQPNPANLTAVCGGSNGRKVQQAIASLCGNNVAVAESAFAATCSSAGVTVASYTASPSSIPTNPANGTFVYTTLSYDSSCSCTKTVVTSATGGNVPSGFGTMSGVQATGSATATSSATGSAGATGAAAPGAQQAVGSLAAAVVAVAGLVAWL